MSTIQVDPEIVIVRYRSDLEAAKHQNLLMEIYAGNLQTTVHELEARITELETENASLKNKVETVVKQSTDSEGKSTDVAGDTTQ